MVWLRIWSCCSICKGSHSCRMVQGRKDYAETKETERETAVYERRDGLRTVTGKRIEAKNQKKRKVGPKPFSHGSSHSRSGALRRQCQKSRGPGGRRERIMSMYHFVNKHDSPSAGSHRVRLKTCFKILLSGRLAITLSSAIWQSNSNFAVASA
jgi:hypothetical protein